MDELLREMERFKDLTSVFTLSDVALVLSLNFLLSLFITFIYKYTHKGTSYSQSFAQTLVIMGMTVSLIMLVVGSNIARAFSLVGALSIIRFRNAVKETRDVGFMFLAMSIGMTCGTRFYLLACIATAALSAVCVIMYKLDLFSKAVTERVLRVHMPVGVDFQRALEPAFRELLVEARLISMETVRSGSLTELVYSVVLKPRVEPQALLAAIRAVNDNQKVILVVGQQEGDL